MTALEKLSIELNPTDEHVADEFFSIFRRKCPDEVFPCALSLCKVSGDYFFQTCVKCWLQEVGE